MIKLKSPAKINLFLKITKKRDDGYHEISTLFQMINLCDIITLTKYNKGISITSNSTSMPLNEDNLVYKAAESLFSHTGISSGVKIHIEKNIPIAAGLGGGSSNAATLLIGLNKLYNLKLKRKNLFELAKPLGADVPFFLYGPTAYGEGIGDILTNIKPLKKMHLVLVNPGIKVPASYAYANLMLTNYNNNSKMIDYFHNLDSLNYEYKFINDLEHPVIKKYGVIAKIKDELCKYGAKASLMSGSGSTVFGVFEDNDVARYVAKRFKTNEWSVFVTDTINNLDELEQ